MNHLNSILLEGKVSNYEKHGTGCTFLIWSRRFTNEGDGTKTIQETMCKVHVTGMDLANAIEKRDFNGTKQAVRVAGRIANDDHTNVILVAEHVEFKPIIKER